LYNPRPLSSEKGRERCRSAPLENKINWAIFHKHGCIGWVLLSNSAAHGLTAVAAPGKWQPQQI